MNTMNMIKSLVGAVAMIILIFLVYAFGSVDAETRMEKKAIAAGVAHYEVNPTNGITTFVYGVNTNK